MLFRSDGNPSGVFRVAGPVDLDAHMKALPGADRDLIRSVSEAMKPAPKSAQEFVVSALSMSDNEVERIIARQAGSVITRLPSADVKRLFTVRGTSSKTREGEHYFRRLQDLGGSEPLAFSGRKLVVLTARSDDKADELRQSATRSAEVEGLTPAAALEEILTGRGETPTLAGLKTATVQVLAQKDSGVWFHASDPETMPHLGFAGVGDSQGGASGQSASGGSEADRKSVV